MNNFDDNICQNNGKRYTKDEGDEYISENSVQGLFKNLKSILKSNIKQLMP